MILDGGFVMKTVFLVYGENEETRPNVVGVSTSKENADKLIKELDEHFDGFFEYFLYEIPVNMIDPNGFMLFD
jgi:hypothetical protein